MADGKGAGEQERVIVTEDDESVAWDICEDYIARDRDLFGDDSPHSFGVKTLFTSPKWTYAVYVKTNVSQDPPPAERPARRYRSDGR